MSADRSSLYTQLEALLTHRKSELMRRLTAIEGDLERVRPADDDDRAVESDNDEVLEGMGQAGKTEIGAIDAALLRLGNGTFGACARCGQPISEERLWAVPHTPLCEVCASAL